MAIQWAVIYPIVSGLATDILEIPIIHRAIENWVKRTETWLDDIFWSAVERILDVDDPPEIVEEKIKNVAEKVQEVYDNKKTMVNSGINEDVAIDAAKKLATQRGIWDWNPAN